MEYNKCTKNCTLIAPIVQKNSTLQIAQKGGEKIVQIAQCKKYTVRQLTVSEDVPALKCYHGTTLKCYNRTTLKRYHCTVLKC